MRIPALIFLLSFTLCVGMRGRAWSQTVPDQQAEARAIELVEQLGSRQFAARERATEELIELGIHAVDALTQGARDPDREVRFRSQRLLELIEELDLQKRLDQFLSDIDVTNGHGLPGWDRYRDEIGSSDLARQMFAKMQKIEPALMTAVEQDRESLARLVPSRIEELRMMMLMNSGDAQIELASLAALLFAGTDEKAALSATSRQLMSSYLYQASFRAAISDRARRPVLVPLVSHWIRQSDGENLYNSIWLGMQYDIKATVVAAEKVLSGPGNAVLGPHFRHHALLALARFGNRDHVVLAEQYLDDTTGYGAPAPLRANQKPVQPQIRDVALAAAIELEDRDHRDYGFANLQRNSIFVFVSNSLAFESDEARDEAIHNWRQRPRDRRP